MVPKLTPNEGAAYRKEQLAGRFYVGAWGIDTPNYGFAPNVTRNTV